MIFVTGDKHGSYDSIVEFCSDHHTTKDDLMVVLGDNGVNYYGDKKDRRLKKKLQDLPITFMMIRGNHDKRPGDICTYEQTFVYRPDFAGVIYAEKDYPSLMFTKEYGLYRLNDKDVYVIGGAYSVDKQHRLERYDLGFHQFKWFHNEQLSDEERRDAEYEMSNIPHIDYIMTHTCPRMYKPFDMMLGGIDQSTVDDSMETWLGAIEFKTAYDKWFCGHWHTDRTIDKIRFMYNDIIELE